MTERLAFGAAALRQSTAIFTALAMASLDTMIANIALPAIAADLHVSPADVVWVVNVYQIALVASLLPLGALGDIVGHERIYLAGVMLFTLASLGCACAWSLPSLLVARTLQGLGASGMMASTRRWSASSIRAACWAAASATTPWWSRPPSPSGRASPRPSSRSAVAMAVRHQCSVRPDRAPDRHQDAAADAARRRTRFDFIGAALAAGCLGLFIIGDRRRRRIRSSPIAVIAILVAALAFGWLLMRRHADHPAPMLPIDLFRRPLFALSALTAVCSFAVQGLTFVALPFYFEDVLGRSQVETGLFMTPWPLVVAIMAPIGGRLSDRFSAGILGGLGLVLLGVGMALLAALPADPSVTNIVWRMAICGIGFGFFQTPEHAGDHDQRAAASRRQRQRHCRDRPAGRTNDGRRLCRALLQPCRPRRRGAGACGGSRICLARQRHEFFAA